VQLKHLRRNAHAPATLSRTIKDTGDAAVSGRPPVPVITEKQQESPAFAAGALV